MYIKKNNSIYYSHRWVVSFVAYKPVENLCCPIFSVELYRQSLRTIFEPPSFTLGARFRDFFPSVPRNAHLWPLITRRTYPSGIGRDCKGAHGGSNLEKNAQPLSEKHDKYQIDTVVPVARASDILFATLIYAHAYTRVVITFKYR